MTCDDLHERGQLEVVEPITGVLLDPGDLLVEACRGEVGEAHLGRVAVVAEAGEPHRVGGTGREGQHPASVAADQQRHPLAGGPRRDAR